MFDQCPIMKLEIIQNSIAPPKRVQIRKNLAPWYNKKLIDFSSYKEDIHKMAIINDDVETWREFRKVQNSYNKMVREEKMKFYNKKLNIHNFDENGSKNEFSGSKNMWNTVKTLSGKPNM